MAEIVHPHDRGYKYLLSSEKLFLQLLQSFADRGWVSQLDVHTIVRVDKSYILQDFNAQEADLVYRLKIKGQEVIFYLLLELQSTVDFQMPYRLLLYMTEIWRDVLKNTPKEMAERKDFRLPPVVPLVLYNGADNWTVERRFRETLAGGELFGDELIDFRYLLIDVNRYEEETLKELPNLIKAVMLLDRKGTSESLIRRLKEIAGFLKTVPAEDYGLFKSWFQTIAIQSMPEHAAEVSRIIAESSPEEVTRMIYNFELTVKEMKEEATLLGEARGKAEGILEGKLDNARRMLAKNLPEDLIVELTGLSPEQLACLKNASPGGNH